MRQIEITVRLMEDMESAIKKLEEIGFKKLEEFDLFDIYMTSKLKDLQDNNIQDILKKSLLLRTIKTKDKVVKKITYKNKDFDGNGDVISETKINLECNDLESAKLLFEKLDFEELVTIKDKVIVYAKDNIEYAFQVVDGLGTLIEYENKNDFDGKSLKEINDVKEVMFNEIKSIGLNITNEKDVKKAYELIVKKYFSRN